jgi:hypothetical protein
MIYFTPTQCVYAFHFRKSSINRFVFIMEVQFVFCEVEAEFLNSYTKLELLKVNI